MTGVLPDIPFYYSIDDAGLQWVLCTFLFGWLPIEKAAGRIADGLRFKRKQL